MDSLIVNRQWSSRPMEERHLTLTDLHEFNLNSYRTSQQKVMSLKNLEFRPDADDSDGKGLQVVFRDSGKSAGLSNWSYNQLANQLGAMPGFTARLPAKIASDVLNWSIDQQGESDKSNFLATRYDDQVLIRSVTGEKYGRIWNYQISAPLVERFGDGITGDWTVPGEFGKKVEITKQNTTLYRSDRDMFVCLVDEKNKIQVPNRRNGKTGEVSRGFIITNSEVGAGVIAVYFFTFDYFCMNRTIWGLDNVTEIKLRHTLNAPERWLDEIAPAIENYGQVKASAFEQRLITAQNTKLDKPAEEILKAKLDLPGFMVTDKMLKSIVAAYKADEPEHPIMETVFDLTVGVTAYARSIQFQNERVPVERAAGKLLELVA